MKRLAILLFIFFSCSNVDEQSLIIDKIPDNPLLVLSIDNVNDIDYETINFISNSIDLDLDDINLFNPSDELTYSFHKSGKNKINGIIIQKSQDLNIDKKEMHKESHSFKPGKKITLTVINNIKIGLTICYDLRFPNLFRKLAKKGAEVILSPAAFTVPTGKDHWEILTRARAIENSVFIIATNMCGTHHTNRQTYGHSVLVSPWGKLLKKGFKKPIILNTKINLNDVMKSRIRIPSLSHD